MKNSLKLFIAVFFVSLFYTNVGAQNYNDALRLSAPGINSGARALGMGNAYISLSNDFSGTIFNPAGLGKVRRMEFTGSLNSHSLENSADFFNTNDVYSNSNTGLNQLGFVFPFPTYQGSLVFALGYNRVQDFNSALKFNAFNSGDNSMIQYLLGLDDISYMLYLTDATGDVTPINGKLYQRGNILEEGHIGSWALSGAIEVSKNIFVGATLNLYSGTYNYDRRYYEHDIDDIYGNNVLTDPEDPDTKDFRLFYLNDIIDWDISGWDFKLGVLYDLPGFINVGATIKFPTLYNIEEAYNVYAKAEFGTDVFTSLDPQILNTSEYEITTPFEFAVGGSIDIANLIFTSDIKFVDYSQMEFSDGLSSVERNDNNRDIKELFRSVINYNVGFEYELPVLNMRVRGGFMYVRSPFEGDPTEYDKKFFTGGLGFYASRTLRVDIAYVHGWWKNIGYNYGSGDSRTFQDIQTDNIVFNMTYGM